jgi:thioesterase DpgC
MEIKEADLLTLVTAGIPVENAKALLAGREITGDWTSDKRSFETYWALARTVLEHLPVKKSRKTEEQNAADLVLRVARKARDEFLTVHVERVYESLTSGYKKFLRVEDLAEQAAALVPGLVPERAAIEVENRYEQKHKDGHEIDQGIFFGHVLANPKCGTHLVHAMLLPHPKTHEYLDRFLSTGKLELETALVERRGQSTILTLRNPRFMNAEDDTTVDNVEIGVDLCHLDPETTVAVMRGGAVERGKTPGQRVFCSGVNLTHIYHGKLSYLWYLKRDMGFINKIYRGLASEESSPDEVYGATLEKVWIAAIERFAIGGGCQYLLAMDINIASSDAYMTLPARKEGIIPGVANMRMPRFVGDRVTRQAIMADRRIDCASPEGRMICDRIVEAADMDNAVDQTVEEIMNSGVVSASGNRRAMRVTQEPVDMFRRYMAVYAREQAYCHFSPALIQNLERFWNANNKQP